MVSAGSTRNASITSRPSDCSCRRSIPSDMTLAARSSADSSKASSTPGLTLVQGSVHQEFDAQQGLAAAGRTGDQGRPTGRESPSGDLVQAADPGPRLRDGSGSVGRCRRRTAGSSRPCLFPPGTCWIQVSWSSPSPGHRSQPAPRMELTLSARTEHSPLRCVNDERVWSQRSSADSVAAVGIAARSAMASR